MMRQKTKATCYLRRYLREVRGWDKKKIEWTVRRVKRVDKGKNWQPMLKEQIHATA
jgi:hypothetical protein